MAFNKWNKTTSPHFVVYTDASLKEATSIVKKLEMLHQATQFFLRRKSLNLAPVIIVLPTKRSDWRKIQSKGSVKWEVASTMAGTVRNVLLVEYDWQSDGLANVWSLIGARQAAAMNLGGPFWYTRGLLRFFSTVEFDGDTLTIGKQGYDSFWIQRLGWMSWPRFFSINSNSPEFIEDSDRLHQFESQAAILVHHLLTSGDPASTAQLLGWAAYLQAGNPATEESFKEIFQCDWKEWEARLEKIFDGGTYKTGSIRFPPAALNFRTDTTDVSATEMRELFVLCQIISQDVPGSKVALESVLKQGLKTPALAEILVNACIARGRGGEALGILREIIGAGTANPAVYSTAATLALRGKTPARSIDVQLGPEADEIRAWCGRALEIEPLLVEANNQLAWMEAFSPTVDRRNLETIVSICRRLDGNAPTDVALAALTVARWRSGGVKQARSLAERLQASVLAGPDMKAVATEVLARLDGPGMATPAAASTSAAPPAAPAN